MRRIAPDVAWGGDAEPAGIEDALAATLGGAVDSGLRADAQEFSTGMQALKYDAPGCLCILLPRLQVMCSVLRVCAQARPL